MCPIVDMRYKQRDLEGAVEASQKENLLLKSRCEASELSTWRWGISWAGLRGSAPGAAVGSKAEGSCQNRNPERELKRSIY